MQRQSPNQMLQVIFNMLLHTPKLYKTDDDVSQQALVTVRFLIPPSYKEDEEDGDTIPGCIGELKCGELYLKSGGEGCHVRYQCEEMAWEQYGPGGRCRSPYKARK